ncbi:MAG: hypothetical protein GYB31_03795 [Bacteroidetes bacterium]|nr:hypothetical protein [Bacteroidota bacterium]
MKTKITFLLLLGILSLSPGPAHAAIHSAQAQQARELSTKELSRKELRAQKKEAKKEVRLLSWVSLSLGIVGLALFAVTGIGTAKAFLILGFGIAGLIMGLIARKKEGKSLISTLGIFLSGIGVIAGLLFSIGAMMAG